MASSRLVAAACSLFLAAALLAPGPATLRATPLHPGDLPTPAENEKPFEEKESNKGKEGTEDLTESFAARRASWRRLLLRSLHELPRQHQRPRLAELPPPSDPSLDGRSLDPPRGFQPPLRC
jgi:hypothetical protein